MRENYLVSRTYSEVTSESAKEGDFSDCGYVYDDIPYSLDDLLRELRECRELSCYPASCINGHTWASTEFAISDDYNTMTERQESLHIRHISGRELSPQRMRRIYRMAGLCQ